MPGIGVTLQILGGYGDTARIVSDAMGKTIVDVQICNTDDTEEDSLRFRFADGSGIKLLDGGQSCCETRYMHTDDKLEDFVGAVLQNIEIQDGPEKMLDYDVQESQFLVVTTSKGVFTVVNYNEHNGYYGGFAIIAHEV
jgi:hypothetical protein